MRLRSIALFTALPSLLVACGGGGGDPDARPRIDMRTTPDAAPFACHLATAFPDPLSLATADMPFAFDAQRTMAGAGEHAVVIIGTLSDVEPRTSVLMVMIDNAGMFAPAGALGPFAGGPTALDVPLDAGATCGGCLEGYTGYGLMGTNPDLGTATQIYLLDDVGPMGTLDIATFNPGAVDNGTSQLFGSYKGVKLSAYEPDPADPMNLLLIDRNADTVADCTTTFAELNFFFEPTWVPVAAAPSVNAPTGLLHGVNPAKIPSAPITGI
jgi:hypothetical protein